MGRLIFSAIGSLDGYMADADGDFSWAVPDEEVLADINAESRTVGTYLYGRRIYEMMVGWENDPEAAAQSPESAEFAKVWQSADKVVYSSTLAEVSTRRTRLERRFEAPDVEEIKRGTDADLYVDGPTLAGHAMRVGVVDRLHLLLCPVVIGGGLAILPPDLRLDLRLDAERRYGNGMVALQYEIVR
ncbi:dihydrofolate reductase family protein [Actinomycetospora flava]|uniref:Dihydrofolate reductase family protein n=1 Tax=Actinomycetospora flava TaxID=3129232 RepID=A0ABU8M7U7_9PSEU